MVSYQNQLHMEHLGGPPPPGSPKWPLCPPPEGLGWGPLPPGGPYQSPPPPPPFHLRGQWGYLYYVRVLDVYAGIHVLDYLYWYHFLLIIYLCSTSKRVSISSVRDLLRINISRLIISAAPVMTLKLIINVYILRDMPSRRVHQQSCKFGGYWRTCSSPWGVLMSFFALLTLGWPWKGLSKGLPMINVFYFHNIHGTKEVLFYLRGWHHLNSVLSNFDLCFLSVNIIFYISSTIEIFSSLTQLCQHYLHMKHLHLFHSC